ncbi:hypothetical protein [Burkholderia gladioli]|uniref:hypothetical protein n=1 Tax=Burkholderia gladioli TaxID=28095 RepID=UPI0016405626|nr:hypothetical protein [Burkholderia gladioli]
MNTLTTNVRMSVNPVGLAVMVLGSAFAVGVGMAALLLTWRGLLPGFFAVGVFPLTLGTVSLLTSGLHRASDENMDRWLGVQSLQGEARAAAQTAYADLMLDDAGHRPGDGL